MNKNLKYSIIIVVFLLSIITIIGFMKKEEYEQDRKFENEIMEAASIYFNFKQYNLSTLPIEVPFKEIVDSNVYEMKNFDSDKCNGNVKFDCDSKGKLLITNKVICDR